MLTTWHCPLPGKGEGEELALVFDKRRERRLLILPALFDEANKLRRQTVEVMRRLDLSGIDCVLPDLPGWNESLAPLEAQTMASWREAVAAAVTRFAPTHLLAIRGGALLATDGLPGWRYAPTTGRQVLRAMLRARTISAREAGREETIEALEAVGRNDGIELAGWHLGPKMFAELENAVPSDSTLLKDIAQGDLGGAGLWLRAEPDENPEQADALAAIVAIGMSGE